MEKTSVHPHLRGDYTRPQQAVIWYNGSSPPAWGLRVKALQQSGRHRFIPTCVGITFIFTLPFYESVRFIPTCVGITVVCPSEADLTDRFIPTCVGITMYPILPELRAVGSSPRAWGLPPLVLRGPGNRAVHPHLRGDYFLHQFHPAGPHRFIPTCVGITSAGCRPACRPGRFIPTCVGITRS